MQFSVLPKDTEGVGWSRIETADPMVIGQPALPPELQSLYIDKIIDFLSISEIHFFVTIKS